MRALVTGGAGYVGSHMVKFLLRQGYAVDVLDDLSTGHRDAVTGGELIEGSLLDTDFLDRVIGRGYDIVIHFAGSIAVGESVIDPSKYFRNNLVASINLADAMVRSGHVNKLVFSSTAAIFGNPEYVPVDEGHPKSPMNPYGRTKLCFEHVLDDYGRAYGLRSVSLRYFNAAGADPEGLLGERHDPETHLIPLALRATKPTARLMIFGDDYDTKDGTCVRDYVHVTDLCAAHLLAIRHLLSGGESRQYNLGCGQGYSVRQIIEMVQRVTGRAVNVESGERRAGDPAVLIADSSSIAADWGWRPQYGLEDMVRHAWRWEQENGDV